MASDVRIDVADAIALLVAPDAVGDMEVVRNGDDGEELAIAVLDDFAIEAMRLGKRDAPLTEEGARLQRDVHRLAERITASVAVLYAIRRQRTQKEA